jgi:hypothetical protein
MNTQDYWIAVGGDGPHADTWNDKPHRLLYDLCQEIDRLHRELPTTRDGEIITLGMVVWTLSEGGRIDRIQVTGVRLAMATYSLLNSEGVDAYAQWAFSTEEQAKAAKPSRLNDKVCEVQSRLEELGAKVYVKRYGKTYLRITATNPNGEGMVMSIIRRYFPDAYTTSGGYSNRKMDITVTLETP